MCELPDNLRNVSEEQGELFHQDIKVMEEDYQARWGSNVMADYCWNLTKDIPEAVHRRSATKRKFIYISVTSFFMHTLFVPYTIFSTVFLQFIDKDA